MSDSTIYELTVLHIKPKYMIEFLTELPQAQKLYAQHGAKYLGTWLSDAGALSQIYSLVEWASIDARAAQRMAALSDAAYVAYAMKTSRYIQKAEDFLGKSEIPVKPFLGNQPVFLDVASPTKIEPLAVRKILEANKVYENEMKENVGCNIVFNPFNYEDHTIWSIWEFKPGHKLELVANAFVEERKNPSHWPHMEENRDYFHVTRSIMAIPIQFDKLPKP